MYPHIAIIPPESGASIRPPNEGGPTATDQTIIAVQDLHTVPENHYDGYETDPPAHYPKPGNGLARTLPPESEDLPWLIDDNFDVFQQINYQAHAPETNGSGTGFDVPAAAATAGAIAPNTLN
jgi:hypothetical protein